METSSFVAAIVSIILGVYAIWLSIVFYRMSVAASAKLDKASSDVADNVRRLETLFDRMYSDTFSLVRDTYADMRREMWSKHEGAPEPASVALLPKSGEDSVGPTPESASEGPLPDPSVQAALPVPSPSAVVRQKRGSLGSASRPSAGRRQALDAMRRGLARMWAEGRPVTASNLTDIAEKLGSDPTGAIEALFDMHGHKEFYTVGRSLGPGSRLVSSADEAERLYEEKIDEQLDEVLGESHPPVLT